MENNYQNIPMVKKKKLMTEQLLVENNVITSGDVVKILATSACVVISPEFVSCDGELTINGKILLNILYLTGDGEVTNTQEVSPFTFKAKNNLIDGNGKYVVCASAISNDLTARGGNELKIVSTINFDIYGIKNAEQKCLSGADKCFVKTKEITSLSHAGNVCEKFDEELETTVRGGVSKILSTTVELAVKDVNFGTGFASVSGDLYAKILYVDGGENKEIRTLNVEKAFKQEFETEGTAVDMQFDVMPYVVYDDVKTEIVDGENECKIIINVPMMMCFNFYKTVTFGCIDDMYAEDSIIQTQKQTVEFDDILKPFLCDGKIEGSVMLPQDSPRVDKLLCATNVKTNTTGAFVLDGRASFEGIVTANVLYLNDEIGEIQSVEIEIPYIITSNTDYDNDTDLYCLTSLSDVDVMVKKGKEIFFDAKARVFAEGSKKCEYEVVTDVQKVGDTPKRDNSLEIYFGKAGETIWDIAKNLKISSEMILSQNPNLNDPLDQNENIAIYYQRKRQK